MSTLLSPAYPSSPPRHSHRRNPRAATLTGQRITGTATAMAKAIHWSRVASGIDHVNMLAPTYIPVPTLGNVNHDGRPSFGRDGSGASGRSPYLARIRAMSSGVMQRRRVVGGSSEGARITDSRVSQAIAGKGTASIRPNRAGRSEGIGADPVRRPAGEARVAPGAGGCGADRHALFEAFEAGAALTPAEAQAYAEFINRPVGKTAFTTAGHEEA